MKILTLTKEYHDWRYRTNEGTLVSFEKCLLGKHKGKLFMSVWSENNEPDEVMGFKTDGTKEEYLLEVTKEIKFRDQPRYMGNGTVRVLEVIGVGEHKYSRKEVFFNEARTAKFAIEEGNIYSGYTFDRLWNGWDCPYFTKETAMEICKEFDNCFYDEKTDSFYCINDDSETEKIAPPTEINTPDGRLKVYDFGYAGWIWSEADEKEDDDEREDEDED